MHRRLNALPSVVMVGTLVWFGLSRSARAAPGAPPPEVQAIFDKMKAGQPPNAEERQILRGWQSQRLSDAAGNPDAGTATTGAMPSDVQEIIARTRQGIPPTPAETERLKAWAAQAKEHKGDLLDTADQLKQQLDSARPQHSTARHQPGGDDLVRGSLIVSLDQTMTSEYADGNSRTHLLLNLTMPVAYVFADDEADGGGFKISCYPDGQLAPSGTLSMDSFERRGGTTTTGSGTASVTRWGPYTVRNPKIANFNAVAGVISRPKGAPRPYLLTLATPVDGSGSAHFTRTDSDGKVTNSSGELRPSEVAPGTIDNLQPGVEGSSFSAEALAAMQQYGVNDPVAKSPQLSDALKSVTFTFDLESFRKQLSSGRFSVPASYRYAIQEPQRKVDSKLTLTVRVGATPRLHIVEVKGQNPVRDSFVAIKAPQYTQIFRAKGAVDGSAEAEQQIQWAVEPKAADTGDAGIKPTIGKVVDVHGSSKQPYDCATSPNKKLSYSVTAGLPPPFPPDDKPDPVVITQDDRDVIRQEYFNDPAIHWKPEYADVVEPDDDIFVKWANYEDYYATKQPGGLAAMIEKMNSAANGWLANADQQVVAVGTTGLDAGTVVVMPRHVVGCTDTGWVGMTDPVAPNVCADDHWLTQHGMPTGGHALGGCVGPILAGPGGKALSVANNRAITIDVTDSITSSWRNPRRNKEARKQNGVCPEVNNNSIHMQGLALDLVPSFVVPHWSQRKAMCLLQEAGLKGANNAFAEHGPVQFVRCDSAAPHIHVHADNGPPHEGAASAAAVQQACGP